MGELESWPRVASRPCLWPYRREPGAFRQVPQRPYDVAPTSTGADRPCAPSHGFGARTPARITGGLLVGRLRVVNPLVPTPMDVVAALVWWAMALLVLSVLVAFVVRVTRRRRARSGAAPTEVGG